MSAQKMREVTRQIHGRNALQAQAILKNVPRKSAYWVEKTLASAMANAQNNNNLKVEVLRVKAALTGTGRTLKRFVPKARGSAGPIRKRSCNVTIVLSDE
jgi:large subunit ribosomal protein L22